MRLDCITPAVSDRRGGKERKRREKKTVEGEEKRREEREEESAKEKGTETNQSLAAYNMSGPAVASSIVSVLTRGALVATVNTCAAWCTLVASTSGLRSSGS